MEWLWTWKGEFFGYKDGSDLWTYKGKHVGTFYGTEVYDRNGNYLGEIKSDKRLITDKRKKEQNVLDLVLTQKELVMRDMLITLVMKIFQRMICLRINKLESHI